MIKGLSRIHVFSWTQDNLVCSFFFPFPNKMLYHPNKQRLINEEKTSRFTPNYLVFPLCIMIYRCSCFLQYLYTAPSGSIGWQEVSCCDFCNTMLFFKIRNYFNTQQPFDNRCFTFDDLPLKTTSNLHTFRPGLIWWTSRKRGILPSSGTVTSRGVPRTRWSVTAARAWASSG